MGNQYWEVWYPRAASTGVLLARGFLAEADALFFHSPPDMVTVEVSDEKGNRLAFGKDLKRTNQSPMCRLRRQGSLVTREDAWPSADDLGSVVMLPGGEAGVLRAWWNAPDKKEWRWQVEFYNTLR